MFPVKMKRRSTLGRRNRNPQSPAPANYGNDASVQRNDERNLSHANSSLSMNPFETPRSHAPFSLGSQDRDWSVFKSKNRKTPEALSYGHPKADHDFQRIQSKNSNGKATNTEKQDMNNRITNTAPGSASRLSVVAEEPTCYNVNVCSSGEQSIPNSIPSESTRISSQLAALEKQWTQKLDVSFNHLHCWSLETSRIGPTSFEKTVVDAHSTPFVMNNSEKPTKGSLGSSKSLFAAVENLTLSENSSAFPLLASQDYSKLAVKDINKITCQTPLQSIESPCKADSDVENWTPKEENDSTLCSPLKDEQTLNASKMSKSQGDILSSEIYQLLKDQCILYNRLEENGKQILSTDEEYRAAEAKLEEIKRKKLTLDEEKRKLELQMHDHLKLVRGSVNNALAIPLQPSSARKTCSPTKSTSSKRKKTPSLPVWKLSRQSLKPSKTTMLSTQKQAPLNKLSYTPRSFRKSIKDQLSVLYGD